MRHLSIDLTGDEELSCAHDNSAYVSFSDLNTHAGTTGSNTAPGDSVISSSSWTLSELFIFRYVISLTALVLALGGVHIGVTQHYRGQVCLTRSQPGLPIVAADCQVYPNHTYATTSGAPDLKIWEQSPVRMSSPTASRTTDIDSSSLTGAVHVVMFTGGWPIANSVVHVAVSALLALLIVFLRVAPTTTGLPVGMWMMVGIALMTAILLGT